MGKDLLGIIITVEPRNSSLEHGGKKEYLSPTKPKACDTPQTVKETSDAFISFVLRKELSGPYPKAQLSLHSPWAVERLAK